MRSYIRHPCDIPIEFSEDTARYPSRERLSNISQGGLAFSAARPQRRGQILRLRIPDVQPPFEAPARVSWCNPVGEGYEVGVEFIMPDDEFRARMVEQVCYIEHYKRRVQELEGRELTGEEAAREWIAKYAARFPDLEGDEP
ncbi:MAG: pilus assembly protein PilZ [Gammaproteobacteria bacterium]|nr:pilus assembly protein PilZ [Gammaproteobacteria bacterium]